MKIDHQGQTFDFPDGTNFNEINEFFSNPEEKEINSKMENQNKSDSFKKLAGIGEPSLAQDIGGGVLSGVKGFYEMLPGSMINSWINKILPEFGISENKNPLNKMSKFVKNFDPYKVLGTENKPFYTPRGFAQLGGELLGPGALIKRSIPAAKAAVNAFRPGVDSEKFLQNLGGGTANQNLRRIGETIETSAQQQKHGALRHAEIVKKEIGKEPLPQVPSKELPEGNLDKVAKIFGKNKNEITQDEFKELSGSIKRYRKHGDFEKFKDESEYIFSHKGLSKNQAHDLEEMLEVPHLRDLNYLNPKNEKFLKRYGYGLKESHDAFKKNPNFARAHKLESDLGKEIGSLKSKKRDSNQDLKYEALKKVYKDLRKDMDILVKDMPKHVQDNWKTFKTKYKENYTPYTSHADLAEISGGKTEGISQATIRKHFANPTKEVKKILGDLPQEGKNYLIYSELAKLHPKDSKGLVNAFKELKRSGDYSHSITPQMENSIASIEKKLNNIRVAKKTGKLAAFGIPALTGTAYGVKKLSDIYNSK